MTKIETVLTKRGWVQDHELPLVLGMSLLEAIVTVIKDDDGTKHMFQSAMLYHKGDRYVFQWARWDQQVFEGRVNLEDEQGVRSDGATHFDPNREAVRAGFGHLLTVDHDESLIRLWKDPREE